MSTTYEPGVDATRKVVLDPDNPDDVERFRLAAQSFYNDGHDDDGQTALRSLLPSSPIPEPNGLGSVAECAYRESGGHAIYDGRAWTFRAGALVVYGRYWGELDVSTVVAHGVGCTCSGPGCPGGES